VRASSCFLLHPPDNRAVRHTHCRAAGLSHSTKTASALHTITSSTQGCRSTAHTAQAACVDALAPCVAPCDALQVLRLCSKSLWDVPVNIPLAPGASKRVHMLLHHPTPPAFDGPEGRNLLRNHDEIRMAADYVGCASCPAPSSAAQPNIASESSSSSRCGSLGHGVVGKVCKAGSMAWTWLRAQLGIRRRQQQHKHQGPADYLYDDNGQRGGLQTGESCPQGLWYAACGQGVHIPVTHLSHSCAECRCGRAIAVPYGLRGGGLVKGP
jgi:hypothetical protein